jgi:hypothetical protein
LYQFLYQTPSYTHASVSTSDVESLHFAGFFSDGLQCYATHHVVFGSLHKQDTALRLSINFIKIFKFVIKILKTEVYTKVLLVFEKHFSDSRVVGIGSKTYFHCSIGDIRLMIGFVCIGMIIMTDTTGIFEQI